MKLRFLGTSAGTPTRRRNVTSQVLHLDHGGLWMLDCGEGTQHRALADGVPVAKLERILITHLHGDHCLGLPGLLSFIAISERKAPVQVVGPRGLREFLNTVLRLTEALIPYPLDIVEWDGPLDLPVDRGWTIRARPIVHRVPCSGYILHEADRPGRFHADRARRIGLPDGPQRTDLLAGRPVRLPDGRLILPSDVCDPPRRGRRIVLLGDTSDPTGVLVDGQGADLLVCEATYADDRAAKAIEWGHMTAGATGAFAAQLGAQHLALTHFSARYSDPRARPGLDLLVAQAQAQAPGLLITAADDGTTIEIL